MARICGTQNTKRSDSLSDPNLSSLPEKHTRVSLDTPEKHIYPLLLIWDTPQENGGAKPLLPSTRTSSNPNPNHQGLPEQVCLLFLGPQPEKLLFSFGVFRCNSKDPKRNTHHVDPLKESYWRVPSLRLRFVCLHSSWLPGPPDGKFGRRIQIHLAQWIFTLETGGSNPQSG